MYDYHPQSSTLFDQHLSPQAVQAALRNPSRHPHHYNPHSINERVLWTYICQLANVIKTVHSAGLAVRTLELSKVLVTGKNRLRVNCCSILDVIRAGDDAQHLTIPNQQVRALGFWLDGGLIFHIRCTAGRPFRPRQDSDSAGMHINSSSAQSRSKLRTYQPDLLSRYAEAGPLLLQQAWPSQECR